MGIANAQSWRAMTPEQQAASPIFLIAETQCS
jgi:hypothetical protein